jgi:DNA primase
MRSSAFSSVMLVEGLFDLAVLWQAGLRNTTCAIGTHLTAALALRPFRRATTKRASENKLHRELNHAVVAVC